LTICQEIVTVNSGYDFLQQNGVSHENLDAEDGLVCVFDLDGDSIYSDDLMS
jgi:hypothetical protein